MRNCYSSNVMEIVDNWKFINDHVHIRCTWTNSLYSSACMYIWINCWHGNLTRQGLYCRHDHSAAAESPSLNCSSPLVANWAWELLASENTISQRDFRSCGGDHVLLQASVFEDRIALHDCCGPLITLSLVLEWSISCVWRFSSDAMEIKELIVVIYLDDL